MSNLSTRIYLNHTDMRWAVRSLGGEAIDTDFAKYNHRYLRLQKHIVKKLNISYTN